MRVSNTLVGKRIMLLFVSVTLSVLLLGGRLVYLQLARNSFFIGKAMDQRLQSIPVDAKRGTIYDRNGIPLAVSVSANAVYAIPNQVQDKEYTAARLSEILELDLEFVLQRLKRNTASEWIKSGCPPRKPSQSIRLTYRALVLWRTQSVSTLMVRWRLRCWG